MQQTIEQIKERFEKDGRGYYLRDWSSFTKVRDSHHMVCPKHPLNDWFRSIHPVLSKRKLGCPICAAEAASERLRADVESVKQRLSEHNFELVGEFINMQKPVALKCSVCGEIKPVKVTNILHGNQGCYNCNAAKPFTKEEVLRRLELVDLILLDEFSGHFQDKHRLMCKHCGDIKNISLHGPLYGRKCSCQAKFGFQKKKQASLYYVYGKNRFGEFYKIGITNRSIKSRNKQTFDSHNIIWSYESDGLTIYNLEQQILTNFKHLIQTDHVFSGSTECFTEDIRKYVDLDKFVCDNTNNSTKE